MINLHLIQRLPFELVWGLSEQPATETCNKNHYDGEALTQKGQGHTTGLAHVWPCVQIWNKISSKYQHLRTYQTCIWIVCQ